MKYAYIDPNSRAVLATIDTDAYSYPEPPSAELLLPVTDDQASEIAAAPHWVVDCALTISAPEVAPPDQSAARRAGILVELEVIDMDSIRPLRAIAAGVAVQDAVAYLRQRGWW
ncbi:MAG TPA: hypothetical protein VD978_36595 [Azospirillum sp.]|nr:hypothetical protein [Azospirillum sp.]